MLDIGTQSADDSQGCEAHGLADIVGRLEGVIQVLNEEGHTQSDSQQGKQSGGVCEHLFLENKSFDEPKLQFLILF